VWGYLLDNFRGGDTLVLKHRRACPGPILGPGKKGAGKSVSKDRYLKDENEYENSKADEGKTSAGGYLIGRHPECGRHLSSSESAQAVTLTFQIESSTSQQFPTGTASFFQRIKMDPPLPSSKISPATVPSLMTHSSAAINDVSFKMVTKWP
jgi:hypothetical protein